MRSPFECGKRFGFARSLTSPVAQATWRRPRSQQNGLHGCASRVAWAWLGLMTLIIERACKI